MRPIETTGIMVLGALAFGLATMAGPQDDKRPASRPSGPARKHGEHAYSAAEQSDTLEENLPKLLAAMAATPGVRARIAGSLAATKAPPAPLTPLAAGLAPGDLERLSALINAAVAGNLRYAQGARVRPNPTLTVMPRTHIVRVEVTYPAPPATKDLELEPLTFDVWVCPDRETALALFWCRRGGYTLLDALPEVMKQSILDLRVHYAQPEMARDEHPPGESASWFFPRMAISVLLPKGHEPMPADRLSFVRGNTVVEASTVEYGRRGREKEWLAWTLRQCVPDVVAVLHAIDGGLVRITQGEEPIRAGALGAGPRRSRLRPVPKPGLTEVSAAEQTDWLDENLPKLLAVMAASTDARARIAGALAATKASPSPMTPLATGLAPGDLERLSALVHAAVARNARYRPGAGTQPRPAVTVMPRTHIVRIEVTYPAPPASKVLKPGRLTIHAWVCPDRATALALFWCRKGGIWLMDPGSDDTLERSILDVSSHVSTSAIAADEDPPGESAYGFNPRLALSFLLPKGHEPIPADRLSFVRGNVVVEASTVEYTRRHGEKEWLAWTLRQCVPDVVAVLHAIDGGLAPIARRDEPGSTGAVGAAPPPTRVRPVLEPGLPRTMAAEQSNWLDETIPKLVDAMVTMAETGVKVTSPLRRGTNEGTPLTPMPDLSGLAPDDLERLSALVHAAVAGSPRYGQGARNRPRPTMTVMAKSRIVRFEITYPAPPASKELEPGPLTVNVWICPHRLIALALFWVRKGGDRFLDTRSNDGSSESALDATFPIKRSVLDPRFHVTASEIALDENPPGESACWFDPRLPISVFSTKPQEPLPAERLTFVRGNVLVEASTVEYAWRAEQKKWRAIGLQHCAPDIVAVLRRIDAGLVRLGQHRTP